MKQKIKTNLENLFNQNIELIKDASFQDISNGLLANNHEVYDLNTCTTRNLYDEESIKTLEALKQNQSMIQHFATGAAPL